MSVVDRESRVVFAVLANLNAAANTALLSFVATKPIKLQRFGVINGTATGMFAAMVLKLRTTPIATGVTADLGTDLLNGVTQPRGNGIYKDVTGDVVIQAGDEVEVAVSVPSGAVSLGEISLEFWELPFAGPDIFAFQAST